MTNIQARLFYFIFVTLATVLIQGRSPKNLVKNVCDRDWELIYAHDEFGNKTFGSKHELRDLVMTGSTLKATLYMPDHLLQLPADNVNKREDEICFQSLKILSHNGTHIDKEVPWLYFIVCTSGHVVERDITPTPPTVFKVAVDWYVKELSSDHKPVYSNFVDGSPSLSSNAIQLHEAAKTMPMVASMKDKPYVFPLHNILIDPETGEVNGENILHLGQKYTDKYISFNDVPYLWYSSWSTTGARDNARYALGGPTAYKHNVDTTSLEWYADTCWRKVYEHDGYGNENFGLVDDLIAHIYEGHRVRVRIDDIAMEASNIRIKSKVVAVQLLNEVTRVGGTGADKYHIDLDTKLRFSIAHTTGRVYSYVYNIGTTNRSADFPVRKTIEWFVDTRPWNVVLKTEDPPGYATRGNMFDLVDAVKFGSSVRLNVELDPLAGSFFTQANNLRIDILTELVYAQAMDHVSDSIARTPNEYELQENLFHWYLLVCSDGSVRMSAWNFGSNTFRYDESSPLANVTWYINS